MPYRKTTSIHPGCTLEGEGSTPFVEDVSFGGSGGLGCAAGNGLQPTQPRAGRRANASPFRETEEARGEFEGWVVVAGEVRCRPRIAVQCRGMMAAMKAMGSVQRTTSLALACAPLTGNPRLAAIPRRPQVCVCAIRNSSSSSIATAPEHAAFLREVAAMEPPASLQSLLHVLQAQGESAVSPWSARKGIIPLAIPLTETQDGEVTALLRWPTPVSGMDVPVVRVQSFGVTLLAKSPEEYIHRALVEDDVAGCSGRIAESAGEVGSALYRRGDFEASQLSSLDVYLMKKVGLFPDVFERLALRHFENGDDISALVTGEYYASKKHFPGFGRPFVFNAELMLKVGRKLEAKDAARCALRSPWWTLGSSYADVASIAGWGEEQIEFMRERVSEEGRQEDLLKGKDLAQVAVDQAAFLLDLAAVDCTWDDVREQLANFYKEGGFEEISRFVSTV